MIKIFNILIFLIILVLFNLNVSAETKLDCSQYSTKTLAGLTDKMRCKKGLPPLKKNFFKSLKIKSSDSNEEIGEKKLACHEYSTKTLTSLIAKIKCKKNN